MCQDAVPSEHPDNDMQVWKQHDTTVFFRTIMHNDIKYYNTKDIKYYNL